MTTQQLQPLIIEWAKERGIFEKGTPIKQAFKTLEECGELIEAIGAYNVGRMTSAAEWNDKRSAILDAVGDLIVTLIIQAEMQGTSIDECLEQAYNEIKDRNGSMLNGTFVKDK